MTVSLEGEITDCEVFDFELSGYETMALFHNYITPKEIERRRRQ